jgi:hypothetical protein
MASTLQSTKAKVTDVQAVQAVLDRYWCDFQAHVEPRDGAGAGTLTLSGGGSPEALLADELPDRRAYPHQDTWDDAVGVLAAAHGEERFAALLRDLAPYLETPLTVLWHCTLDDGGFGGAAQWTVGPGSPHVQVQTVRPLPAN